MKIDPKVTELPEPIPWSGKCVCEVKDGKLDLCAMHGLQAERNQREYVPCRWRCENCQIDVILEDASQPVTMMNHSCGNRLIPTQWAEVERKK